ncbi:Hypothetical protein NGAL_HAMBI490_29970 [Neorhizobium galegae bv. officinalis]|nr:Hypothetical protein NGAL_HAMBI490_29970 [Neorhizobium galegae bv. officinalis]
MSSTRDASVKLMLCTTLPETGRQGCGYSPLSHQHSGRGVGEPDQPAKAYLKVIAVDPQGTAEALAKGAA